MNKNTLVMVSALACAAGTNAEAPSLPPVAEPPPGGGGGEPDDARRATARYEEMLSKMQAAVEEIAELYGNPLFLQVFTNDMQKAAELKLRLKAYKSGEDIQKENSDLERKRQELMGDVALRQREADRLAARLARQRAALDALAGAVEQARRAVEDGAK